MCLKYGEEFYLYTTSISCGLQRHTNKDQDKDRQGVIPTRKLFKIGLVVF